MSARLAAACGLALLGSVVPVAAGTLLVLNKAEATASLIADATGEVVATIPVGDGPHEVAVSPDGRRAVACNYGGREAGSSLTVLDVRRGEAVRTIDLGEYRRPHGIWWLEDGRHVLVTVESNRAVIKVDVKDGRVVQAVETGQDVSHMIAVLPDETRAFVANIRSGSVTALDLRAGKKITDIPTGGGAEGIDVTPDGSKVFVTNRADDTVTIIDAARLQVLATLDCGAFPIRAEATPDGRHVLVTNARSGDMAVIDVDAREEVRRIPLPVELPEGAPAGTGPFAESSVPIGILARPDGTRAYVAHQRGGVISVVDLESWTVVDHWTAGAGPDGMAWSPVDVRRPRRLPPS